MEKQDVKKTVREGYARIASQGSSCCSPASSCCGGNNIANNISKKIGYTDEDLNAVPDGANLGLGCGNPVALASLKKGEVVLDLGSGAGFDCFLAAKKVGPKGKVIGVDMTPEMLDKARANARQGNYKNVEFRLGEIENLPVADNSVDVIISNCVINLSPDKARVFAEAFRALKPSGRLMVSDIVMLKELPEAVKKSAAAYVGCISGSVMRAEYLKLIKKAGFREIGVLEENYFPIDCLDNDPTAVAIVKDTKISGEQLTEAMNAVASVKVKAVKPL